MSQQELNDVPKKLYRSHEDRMLSGVCGGFAAYLNVDSTIVRILWVVLSLLWGVGVLLYIAAMIIIPENPNFEEGGEARKSSGNDKAIFWGGLFILLGVLLLLRQAGFFYSIRFWHIPWQLIWAVFLILIGIFLLFNRKEPADEAEAGTPIENEAPVGRQIYRSRDDKMLAGVCAGLAEYFKLDVTIVRLAYVLLTLASVGVGILAYIIMIIAFPEKPESGSLTSTGKE
jgi:phage shock protein PspC (stress-responsive transcriptional regulator)